MRGAFRPKDHDAREAIRDGIEKSMCVEAGAGTGKTTVLVDRIVKVVSSGHAPIERVAVITFTEKAAAELAARVRQELDAAGETSGDAAERERVKAAIRDLNRAHIETIHAFAASLLRERPIEAGLDPGFEVLADLPAQLDFEAAYDEWLTAEMGSEPAPAALLDALNAGLDVKLVRKAAEVLNDQRDLLPLPPYVSTPLDGAAALAEIRGELAGIAGMAPLHGFEHDNAYVALNEAAALQDELALLRDRPEALRRAIVTAELTKYTQGSKQSNWRTPGECRRVKAGLDAVNGVIARGRNHVRSDATAALLRWLEGFVEYYDGRRREAGRADFQDLLLWARNVVRDNREVRRYFQEKFDAILVDEFQDTDPLQVELVAYLCEEGQQATDWRDVRLRPGSLFVVGDPKQSIYRFRRADIAMYDTVKRRLFGGDVVEIAQSFRSVEPIIAWVNATFDALFVADPEVQPRYIDLEPPPEPPAGEQAAVIILRGEAPSKVAGDVRRVEAEALASLMRREVEGGSWLVRDGAGGARRARYGDIAVLMPTRTDLPIYEGAFTRAGVPYRHEGGRSFFQRQEVRELVAVLRAIDDPSDQVAAVAALRSSAFGCSDEELLLYRAGGGRFDDQHVPEDAPGAVAAGRRSLRELARERHETPLPVLVRRVIERLRLVEFAMLQPQGEQLAANLLKAVDQARAFAGVSNGGLRGFVRWLKENMSRTADETDAAISEESDDVVRVVTIHAAKGLEFPIVAFANMNTEMRDDTTVIPDRDRGTLDVRLGKKDDRFQTPGFERLTAREQAHAAAEEIRKLYVAGTRATDKIIVPLITAPQGKPGACLNDELRRAGADREGAEINAAELPAIAPEMPVWRKAPGMAGDDDVRRVIEEREAWRAARDAVADTASAGLRVVTATSLKGDEPGEELFEVEVRRAAAAEFGTAAHALLERIDLARPEDARELAQAVALEFGMAERAGEMEEVARNVLAGNTIARALRSQRVLRETPFILPLPDTPEGGFAEGRIDLLFEERGDLVVADFKTDRVTAGEVGRRAGEYRTQALVYAWAARAATGMAVREVIFLFGRPAAEHAMACDEAFWREAEELMRLGGTAKHEVPA